MAHGVIDRYPRIRWVIPHAGSFLPEVAHRLAGISRVLVPAGLMERVDVMGNLRGLWWDLAGDALPVMLPALLQVCDPTIFSMGVTIPIRPPSPSPATSRPSASAASLRPSWTMPCAATPPGSMG